MLNQHEGFFGKLYTKFNVSKTPEPPQPPKEASKETQTEPLSEPSKRSLEEPSSNEPPKKKQKLNSEQVDLHMKQIIDYYKSIGQKDKAYVLQKVHDSESQEETSKLKHVINGTKIKSNMMDPVDAAALLLRADLSQIQYKTIKSQSDSNGAHFLPNYNYMLEEKKKTYPENITVTETKASVPLKNLMEKTFDRIMEEPTFRDIVENLSENNNGHILKLLMSYKTGFDVASGQRRYLVSNHFSFCT